jgi:hypothetical protein
VQAIAGRAPAGPGRAIEGGQNGAHAGDTDDTMTEDSRPLAGCILFLRLRAADAPAPRGNADDALRMLAQAAATAWDRTQRVVLQAPDGIAIAGRVAPATALAAARRAASHRLAQGASIALHHGPLRVLPDGRVQGEGLAAAAALAAEGRAGTTASKAFHAALAQHDPKAARELAPAAEATGQGGEGVFRDDPARARSRGQRRTLLAAGGILAILGAGWATRAAREAWEAAHRPALILLDIRPAGEVFVDGVSQGTSPPLERVAVPPGAHTIEVRGARAKPLRLQVELKPGEELPLKHVFAPPPAPRRPVQPRAKPAPEPGPFERFRFW